MIWWVNKKDGLAWGKTGRVENCPEGSSTYSSEEEMMSSNQELFKAKKDLKLSFDLSKLDHADVHSNRAMKAMEAAGYKHGSLTQKGCPLCSSYAESEGITFNQAIELVWQKHLEMVKVETERTKAKSKLRALAV